MNGLAKFGLCLAIGLGIGIALDDILSGFGIGVVLWIAWGLVGRHGRAASGQGDMSGSDAGAGISTWSRDDRIDNDGRWDSDSGGSGGGDSGGGDSGGDGGGGD